MRKFSLIFFSLALIAIFAVGAAAQGTTKHYEKDGLSFDYPADWTIGDKSDAKNQTIEVTAGTSDLQIVVFAHRDVVDTPDKVEQVRSKLVEFYVDQRTEQMKQMGMTPKRTDGTATVGTTAGNVVHVRGSLDGVDGEAGIFWGILNSRAVIFSAFGPDADLKHLSHQLDALRNSVAIAAPAAPGTSPKP